MLEILSSSNPCRFQVGTFHFFIHRCTEWRNCKSLKNPSSVLSFLNSYSMCFHEDDISTYKHIIWSVEENSFRTKIKCILSMQVKSQPFNYFELLLLRWARSLFDGQTLWWVVYHFSNKSRFRKFLVLNFEFKLCVLGEQ